MSDDHEPTGEQPANEPGAEALTLYRAQQLMIRARLAERMDLIDFLKFFYEIAPQALKEKGAPELAQPVRGLIGDMLRSLDKGMHMSPALRPILVEIYGGSRKASTYCVGLSDLELAITDDPARDPQQKDWEAWFAKLAEQRAAHYASLRGEIKE